MKRHLLPNIRIWVQNNWKKLLFEYPGYLILAYIIVVASPYVYRKLPVKIVAARDVSLPEKVYIWNSDVKSLNRGDYIEFNPPLDVFTAGKVLIKKIACMPGDVLEVRKAISGKTPEDFQCAYEYYCNGTLIGCSFKYTSQGHPLVSYTKSGVLDGYFVVGTHRRSYDSKYFGPIKKDHIIAKLKPLF